MKTARHPRPGGSNWTAYDRVATYWDTDFAASEEERAGFSWAARSANET